MWTISKDCSDIYTNLSVVRYTARWDESDQHSLCIVCRSLFHLYAAHHLFHVCNTAHVCMSMDLIFKPWFLVFYWTAGLHCTQRDFHSKTIRHLRKSLYDNTDLLSDFWPYMYAPPWAICLMKGLYPRSMTRATRFSLHYAMLLVLQTFQFVRYTFAYKLYRLVTDSFENCLLLLTANMTARESTNSLRFWLILQPMCSVTCIVIFHGTTPSCGWNNIM